MAESKEELKSLLMRAKEESERASLKLNIKKKENTNVFVSKMYVEKQRKAALVLCFLYRPALTTVHDHWEEQSLDYMDLCRQSDIFAF